MLSSEGFRFGGQLGHLSFYGAPVESDNSDLTD